MCPDVTSLAGPSELRNAGRTGPKVKGLKSQEGGGAGEALLAAFKSQTYEGWKAEERHRMRSQGSHLLERLENPRWAGSNQELQRSEPAQELQVCSSLIPRGQAPWKPVCLALHVGIAYSGSFQASLPAEFLC